MRKIIKGEDLKRKLGAPEAAADPLGFNGKRVLVTGGTHKRDTRLPQSERMSTNHTPYHHAGELLLNDCSWHQWRDDIPFSLGPPIRMAGSSLAFDRFFLH
jgi:hypothetical protein